MIEPTSLWRSLRIQGRVIGALLMREVITRFGRHNLGVLWLVAEPMIFTLGIVALWTLLGGKHGMPVAAFAITGYSSVLLWRNSVTHNIGAVDENMALLYHRNVRLIDVFIARILVEVAGASASFAVLAIAFTALDLIDSPVDLLLVLAGWAMLAWFGTALAILIGSAASRIDLIKRLWMPVAYLLFPLSGAAFMVDWLPQRAQDLVLLLPMVHAVELLREGYFGNVVRTHHDMGYMAAVNLILTLLALLVLRLAARRVGSK